MAAQNVINSVMASLNLGSSSNKTALVLGSGFVCRPTVQILSDAGVAVTVACRTVKNAEKLCAGIKNTRALAVDVSNTTELDEAVGAHDVTISLIPYTFHAAVIKSAIKTKKNVVTTSYISESMKELEAEVKAAGITIMNEIGLDPGIDHLYAVDMIDKVHRQGGKITSFLSYCGGLTAPEDSDNPLGYKFSWSPRGVLLAVQNAAKFYKDGKVQETPGKELMKSAKFYDTGYQGYNFFAYPNRDSTPYRERYAIPEVQSCIRGTLRFGGFCDMIQAIVDMGFLSQEPLEILAPSNTQPPTWAETTAKVLNATSKSEADLSWAISSKAKFNDTVTKERVFAGLRWIGLFSDSEVVTPRGNPLDTLCATLEKKMEFAAGERDFVFLQHKFGIEWKDGKKETRTSTLVEYGEPTKLDGTSTSAMAKLVGVPCGVASLMVLDGRINEKGILAPLTMKLAEPLMAELRKYGIAMQEKTIA